MGIGAKRVCLSQHGNLLLIASAILIAKVQPHPTSSACTCIMVQLATNIHEMTQLVLMDCCSHAIFNQHWLAMLVFSIVLY